LMIGDSSMKKTMLIVSLLLCLSACKQGHPVAPMTTRESFPEVSVGKTRNGIPRGGDMRSSCFVSQDENGGGSCFTQYDTWVTFYNASRAAINPDDVKLNGVTIPRDAYGNDNYTHNTQAFGTAHHWQISTNSFGSIPAIDDSVQAPKIFQITYPRPVLDTVSKSAGFTCTYGDPGTDSVSLVVFYERARSEHLLHTKIDGPMPPSVNVYVPNTGSYFINGSLLASFPSSGVILILVTALRRKNLIVSGRQYGLSADVTAKSVCLIKD